MSSVLSPLNLSLFADIQDLIFCIKTDKLDLIDSQSLKDIGQ